jgi:outer membrane receptor protein involved in Fe transport
LVYRSQIAGRSMVRLCNLIAGDSYGLVNGMNELHQGVELKTAYKITRNIHLKLNGSLGDWKYTKDATAEIFNTKNQSIKTYDLLIKGVRIANSPQLSLFAEAEWRWAHNFYVRLNYYRADRLYAPFSLYDFNNLADRSDFNQWKMPEFELLGASGNYLLKVGKKQTLDLIFGAQNLLDTEYIEQSATNLIEKNPHYTSNQVYYGSGRTWFAGIKVQF